MTEFAAPPPPLACSRPPAGKVLVLAPHPDDETMGPGGALLLHARQSDEIHAVFVCSGVQGDPDGYFPRAELPAMREQEARAAGAILGIRRFTFFGYPDNLSDADYSATFPGLPADPVEQRRVLVSGLAQKLLDIVRADAPATVYYPWPGELNPDHWAVGQAVELIRATQPAISDGISWMGYEIWSACRPETVVDISDVMAEKLRAVAVYKTQLVYRDYEPAVRGLNAYRSMFLEAGATYGEAFAGTYARKDAP